MTKRRAISQLSDWLAHPRAWPLLLAGALLLRLLIVLLAWDAPLEGDARWYAESGAALLAGQGYDAYWPPGLPAYLALWQIPLGPIEGLMRLSMLPWMALLLWQFRTAALPLAGRATTHALLALLALYPALLLHSTEPLSQVPAAALLLLAWNAAQAFRQGRGDRHAYLLGLWLGLLLLFRPSALPILLLWPLLMHRWQGEAGPRRRWLLAWLPGIALLALASGILSYGQERPVLLNDANARNFYLGNNAWTPDYKTWHFGSHWTYDPAHPEGFRQELAAIEALPRSEQQAAYWRAALAQIAKEPGRFAYRSLSRVRTFLAYDSMAAGRLARAERYPLAALALLGDALCLPLLLALALALLFSTGPQDPHKAPLASLCLLYALPYFFSFSHPTYHLPITPLLALMGAAYWGQARSGHGIAPARIPWYRIALGLLLLVQAEWTWRIFRDFMH